MLIVDDELWAAVGLSQVIDWGALDFERIAMLSDPQEALSVILKEQPDAVFTDIRMDGMTGLKLMAAVRASGRCECEFVLVSAYQDFPAAQEALKLGAFGYITKPFDPEEVLDTAQRLRGCKKVAETSRGNAAKRNDLAIS
jgi:two-component system response regulator YesN